MTQTPNEPSPSNYGAPWRRADLILAFDLYCRIPFKKTKANNPCVQELASLIERSPAGVARKLGNFGAFDPELRRQNISGLTHGSQLDREIWDEFHRDWSHLVLVADRLRSKLLHRQIPTTTTFAALKDIPSPLGPSEILVTAKRRIHQAFFRAAVVSSYQERCCITGIDIPECLVGSHIIPWSVNEALRADPQNGLCLSATFDRLFDRGLIAISDEFKVILSGRCRNAVTLPVREQIGRHHGTAITLPIRFHPSLSSLEWHRRNVFHD
mgnify:CR=1 FL=1